MTQYRILIPSEYEALRDNIPKTKHRIVVDTLLFTGMRYSELSMFSHNLGWFDAKNRAIVLPWWTTKTERERVIHLTPAFTKSLDDSIRWLKGHDETLEVPGIRSMARDLRRWHCMNDGDGHPLPAPTPKTFRKTWESWLLASGYSSMAVALSQGHSELISYGHYANLDPRLKSEMEQVKKLTEGWGT